MRCFQLLAERPWAKNAIDDKSVHQTAYSGTCDRCGNTHSLPRSHAAIRAALDLQTHLKQSAPTSEPRMYGVLIGIDGADRTGQLWAYSGSVPDEQDGPWVPSPDLPPDLLKKEREILADLDGLSEEIREVRGELESAKSAIERVHEAHRPKLEAAKRAHAVAKLTRQAERSSLMTTRGQPEAAQQLERLREADRVESGALRRLNRALKNELGPLQGERDALEAHLGALRRRRRALSRGLQTQLHEAANPMAYFPAQGAREEDQEAPPTANILGEHCGRKLLHYAVRLGIRPVGMAEFYWDPHGVSDTMEHGQFYVPVYDPFEPVVARLLCGLDSAAEDRSAELSTSALTIVYQDDQLIVVDKPAGIPSNPDSGPKGNMDVIARLALELHVDPPPLAVHRLDIDASGLMVVAKTPHAHAALSRSFQEHAALRRYIALVEGTPKRDAGSIRLEAVLTAGQQDRPSVHPETAFEVLQRLDGVTLVHLTPSTGRPQQARAHAADPAGLNCPIVGDPLYGTAEHGQRLYLHADRLSFVHPATQEPVSFESAAPFTLESQ